MLDSDCVKSIEYFEQLQKEYVEKHSEEAVLSEVVNPDRTASCGCGVNVATLGWIWKNTAEEPYNRGLGIWKVLIRWEWLCGVVVPYNAEGKIRCERVELLGPIKSMTDEAGPAIFA